LEKRISCRYSLAERIAAITISTTEMNVYASISTVMTTTGVTPFKGSACRDSHHQDITGHAFSLSKSGGVFCLSFAFFRHGDGVSDDQLARGVA
jgi:hypothetical protein